MKASFLERSDENENVFFDLLHTYRTRQIVLYTGAGVSRSSNAAFGVGGWEDLLRSALHQVDPDRRGEFDSVIERCRDQPWRSASWLEETLGRDDLARAIEIVVRNGGHFTNAHRQLSARFLSVAPTLTGLAAFCATILAVKDSRDAFRTGKNDRVAAVLTSNYDCYLEAASAAMFRNRMTFKPVAAYGSDAGRMTQIPVFHVHGYVSLPEPGTSATNTDRKPFLAPVLTEADYEKTWKHNDPFSPTMGPQIHYLRFFPCLFVGFSFRDEYVNELLSRIREEKQHRETKQSYHYAFLAKDDFTRIGSGQMKKFGVKPIILVDYACIPDALGQIYLDGRFGKDENIIALDTYNKQSDRLNHTSYMTKIQYWDNLLSCRNCQPHSYRGQELGNLASVANPVS